MGPLDPIRRLLQGPYDPTLASFEELAGAYAEHPQEVHDEFVRRLHKLVYQAADHRARDTSSPSGGETAEELTEDVFAEFAPQFGSGAPRSLLRRFADVIRRRLGDEAFSLVAYFYYCLLLIYEIRDRELRKLMADAYEGGVDDGTVARLAGEAELPRARMVALLEEGHRAFRKVCDDEFGPEGLTVETEGYVS